MLVCCSLLLFPLAAVSAMGEMKVYLNGQAVQTDPPQLFGGQPYLSASAVRDLLGAQIVEDVHKIHVKKNNLTLTYSVGQSAVTVNGLEERIEHAPVASGETVYLPADSLLQRFGAKVLWDPLTASLFVFQKDESPGGGQSRPPGGSGDQTKPADVGGGPSKPSGNSGDSAQPKPAQITAVSMNGDRISIAADHALQPQHFYLTDPHRIVVDIPNSTLAPALLAGSQEAYGETALHHPLVEKVRYALFSTEPSTVRLVIDLKSQAQYSILAENEGIGITVKEKIYKIVIDAGHGGKDPGTQGASGAYEKDFNLRLAQKIYDLMKKESALEPLMTRTDDTFISLDDRAALANSMGADLFISIHGNAHFKTSLAGTETYYSRPESLAFAQVMHRHVLAATNFPDREVRQADFRVIKDTTMPAVLLEIGYLTNRESERSMLSDEFQDRTAQAVVDAVKEYLGIN
jgi:N-acetylmuramoyl-L-alanine amidase